VDLTQTPKATGPAPLAALRLPIGELGAGSDGRLRLHLPRGVDARGRLRDFLGRARGLDSGLFVLPQEIEAACVVYAEEDPRTVPGIQEINTWHQGLPLRVPQIIGLARFLAEAVKSLEEAGLRGAPESPVQLRHTPRRAQPFRLIVLPAAEATLADWAHTGSDAWLWTAPEVMLGKASNGVAYLIGAALYHSLTGDLFPEGLCERERLQRLLCGRVGSPSKLRVAVAAALPKSMSLERGDLEQLIVELLSPDPARRPPDPEVYRRLGEVARALSAHRLAARWEYEGQRGVALDVLGLHAESAQSSDVAWEAISRLREAKGDFVGALEASAMAVDPGDAGAARHHLRLLCRAAARGAVDRRILADAVVRLDQMSVSSVEETQRLYLSHIQARHLGVPDAALSRLSRPCSGDWAEAVRSVIVARLLSERDEYARVSCLAKEGCARVSAMPGQGGAGGGYIRSYLLLLDGIAHFGAIGRFNQIEFLGDAFKAFIASLDAAHALDTSSLIDANVHWLGWIARFAQKFPSPSISVVHAGVQAYLEATGLLERARKTSFNGVPGIPWYDADILLPVDAGGDHAGDSP
jgi:hypothetical protein